MHLLLGFIVSVCGSIMPSMLNMTVVKFSLTSGRKSAFYLAAGISTILIIQSSIAIYLSHILMRNSDYVNLIQKIATAIFFIVSFYFFRKGIKKKKSMRKERVQTGTAFVHGFILSTLNMFAIPFYFTVVTFLIAGNIFKFTYYNALFFALGSALGTFFFLSLYAIVAKKVEYKIKFLAQKMDLVLGCITGIVAIVNAIYIYTNG